MTEERYISIDIETTGLDPDSCQVLEIGAVIEDWKSPIDKLPTFQCYVKHDEYHGQPFALAMNSRIFEILAKAKAKAKQLMPVNMVVNGAAHRIGYIFEPSQVGINFNNWLLANRIKYIDRITVAGKNFASFDLQFLKRLPHFQDMTSRFRYRYIDPSILYWNPSIDDCRLPDLRMCLDRAGIMDKISHHAVDDAQMVIRLIRHYYDRQSKERYG